MISMVVLGIVHLQGKHVYKANPMENSALIWDSTQMGTKQAPGPSLESATRVEFCPVRVTRGLAFATAAVVGACVCVTSLSIFLGRPSMFGLGPLFDMNREANIPAVYSALLLLAAAALLALIARLERSRKAGFSHYWAVLAVRIRLPIR